jgi:hypothetical protein
LKNVKSSLITETLHGITISHGLFVLIVKIIRCPLCHPFVHMTIFILDQYSGESYLREFIFRLPPPGTQERQRSNFNLMQSQQDIEQLNIEEYFVG